LLEPIPLEVPLPPTPIAVQPVLNATLVQGSENPLPRPDELFAELAELSASHAGQSMPENSFTSRSTASTRLVAISPTAFTVLILAVFFAGMIGERFVRWLDLTPSSVSTVAIPASPPVVDNQLTGRITYRTKQGDSQPDRGARVLIFPEKKPGEIKLSVVGFRPADTDADQQVANATLKALGGGAAAADETGTYHLPLDVGSYRMLILSHFQAAAEVPKDPALLKLLSEFFDKPEELPGRLSHQFTTIRIKGTGDVWDHSF
jgi:hypothetical protein